VIKKKTSIHKNQFYCDLLQVKILDYAACFLIKCDGICRIFMQFSVMNLQKLQFDEKEKKSDLPQHPVLTRLLT